MDKISLSQAVIVEGKYDKIRLCSLLDALIIPTDGFGIFKNKEKVKLIRTLAESCGIVIMTDSDHAGFIIRSHILSITPKGKVFNAYIPDILGKEPRKTAPSKEGKLGVEGVDNEILLDALKKSGVFDDQPVSAKTGGITTADLYRLGLYGGENSREKRIQFQKHLGLPENLNKNMFLDILNRLYSMEEIENLL